MSQIAASSTPFVARQTGNEVILRAEPSGTGEATAFYQITFGGEITDSDGIGDTADRINNVTAAGRVLGGESPTWFGTGDVTVVNFPASNTPLVVDIGNQRTRIPPGGTQTISPSQRTPGLSPTIIGLLSLGGVIAAAALVAILG